MKTIVIDARGYATTTGRYVRKLIEYLEKIEGSQNKRQYIVLLFLEEYDLYKPKVDCFSKLRADFKHYSFEEQFGFLKFLNSLGADLVHFTMPQQPIFYKGKHVTTMHDLTLLKVFPGNKSWLLHKTKRIIGKHVFKQIANTSQHIITPSQYTKDEYVAFAKIDPNKVTVTYESADPASESPVPYSPLFDKSYILYVGQQSNYKNLRRLIQAHQLLVTTLPDLHLVLAGKLTATAIQNQQWVEQNKYKNVVFTDYISEAELAWLYKNCKAYVFPSLMEGFGLPGLEAMTYSAPVVSSNATCLPEIYEHAAHYFNPENVEEISKAINKVLTDEELRKTLVKNGTNQLKKYSWEKMANQTLDIYKKTIK